jgi:hypothetical protein
MGTVVENPAVGDAEALPTLEERRALIERVAASEQFSRSTRLRDFLLYVGKQSLKEGCPEIHEQEIGARVFGRPASYDRSADNIVRVNATELRKRILNQPASTSLSSLKFPAAATGSSFAADWPSSRRSGCRCRQSPHAK